jgi:predicted HTH domain antitoxin
MTITVELPDDISQHEDPAREALEALAIEGYRREKLSSREARELLGMGRIEFDGFLKDRGVTEGAYGVDQLREDIATGDRLRAQGLIPG